MSNFQIGDFVKIVKKWRYYSSFHLNFKTCETTNYGIIIEGEKNKIYYKAYTDEQKFESVAEEEMEFIS